MLLGKTLDLGLEVMFCPLRNGARMKILSAQSDTAEACQYMWGGACFSFSATRRPNEGGQLRR